MVEVKTCSKCGIIKSLSKFHKKASQKDGINTMCKTCSHNYQVLFGKRKMEENPNYYRDIGRKYRKDYPDKHKAFVLKRYYKITIEEYNLLFDNQKGCCAICGIHQNELKRSLNVDHDHITNKIRGLLCDRCNVGLGHFNDSLELLRKAHEYLKNDIL